MCRHGHFHLVDPKAAHCTSDDAPAFSITHCAYLWSHFFHSFRVLLLFFYTVYALFWQFFSWWLFLMFCAFILCLFLFYCFFWCFARVFFLSLSSLLAMNVSACGTRPTLKSHSWIEGWSMNRPPQDFHRFRIPREISWHNDLGWQV